jgi:hypothetical protein
VAEITVLFDARYEKLVGTVHDFRVTFINNDTSGHRRGHL